MTNFFKSQTQYLTYKLRNAIAFKFAKKNIECPMLSLIGIVPKNLSKIHFDFSYPTTHLGDRLFFFPLMTQLLAAGCEVTLSEEDLVTYSLFDRLCDIKLSFRKLSSADLVVIPMPSFLARAQGIRSLLVVDFADDRTRDGIAKELIGNFGRLFGLDLASGPGFAKSNFRCQAADKWQLNPKGRYYLLSNYINSGSFRKFFLNEARLEQKCLELNAQGYQIIHVGSAQDKLNDPGTYSCVDKDLRGLITVSEMVSLVECDQVVGAVTYDNFLMHLVGIFKKKAYVLFRGRFSRKNREHHFRCVNTAFFKRSSDLTYL